MGNVTTMVDPAMHWARDLGLYCFIMKLDTGPSRQMLARHFKTEHDYMHEYTHYYKV